MTRQWTTDRAVKRDLRRETVLRWARNELNALRTELAVLKRLRAERLARARLVQRRGRDLIEIRAFL